MATTSYGSITIVDITDVGEFSVYPQGNKAQTQIYNPDQSGNLAYTPNWAESNNSLVITPTAFYAGKNKTDVATYSWKKYINGSLSQFTTNEVISGTRNEVLTINANILTAANPIVTYEVIAQYSSPEFGTTPLEAVGRIDFSLISRGSSAKTVKIIGDNTFAYDTNGNLKNISPIVLTANYSNVTTAGTGLGWKYKVGNTGTASDWVAYPSTGPEGDSNITTGSTSTLKVHHNQEVSGSSIFTGDTLTIKFQAKDINNNEISDIFTITKLRDGGLITSATLTNDNQMLPADKDGNIPAAAFGEATTTKITIYNEQGEIDTTNWDITISNTTGITYKVSKNGDNWYDPDNTDKAYTWVKVIGMTSSVDTGKISFTCVNKIDNTLRLEKQFSLVKVKAGKDGREPEIYDITANFVAVNKAASTAAVNPGAYSPSKVLFTATKTVGTTTTSPWAEGYIQIFADNSVVDTSTNARGTVEYTFAGNNITVFKAVLYSDNSFTTELASQSVTVVKDGDRGADGKQGLGAINVVINNEHDSIVCNSANTTTASQTLSITYTGYQGTTPRDTTISAPTLNGITYTSGGTTYTSITGTVTHTAGTATGTISFVIPSGATISTNGSSTLTFGVLGQHYDSNGNLISDSQRTSIEKLFTWSRSASPASPDSPVLIVMEYPEGQLYKNSGGGPLHINAILYDGNDPVSVENVTSYTWTQYDGTRNQADKYGPLKNGASANNNILTVNAIAVDSYASFRVVIEYNDATYKGFGSLTDKFDPLQISVHSTIGEQIKNGQGFGALYVKVRQDNKVIDEIPLNIAAVTDLSNAPADATYCILCVKPTNTTGKADTVACRGSATLHKKTGNSWDPVTTRECTYEWTYHDVDGEPITTGVTRHPALTGQCVYIDASLINSKITADVTVTKN